LSGHSHRPGRRRDRHETRDNEDSVPHALSLTAETNGD
jgi:hypothetical protein